MAPDDVPDESSVVDEEVKPVGKPWVKGQSGNPHGRKPVGYTLAEALRKQMPAEKLSKLVCRIAEHGEKDQDRLKALMFIAERAYPAPPIKLEHSGAIATTGVLVIPALDAVMATALASGRPGDSVDSPDGES